ncbi:MAG: YfaZ family outer membrane protein [Granulosicoccus sp.]
MKKALAGLALLLCPLGVNAGGLDLALSNETANLSVLLNPYQFYEGGGSELALGGFISESGDNLLHATLMARGYRQTSTSQYNLGAGIKAIAGDVEISKGEVEGSTAADDESVGAVALGFQAGLLIASSRYNPMELSFEGFYAPSITSFSDAERYSEFSARLQVEVIPQARAYIGYRRMRFNTNDYNNIRLDRSIHIGLKITY